MFFLNYNNYYFYYENVFVKINFLFFFGIFLFLIGIIGTFLRVDRLIIFLMCIELMWLGISLCFLNYYTLFNFDKISLIFSLLILTVAAGETAIGLSLIVNFYRINKSISLRYLSNLRG